MKNLQSWGVNVIRMGVMWRPVENVQGSYNTTYLDIMRNAFGQTAVAPYAVRAKPGAPVATPLDWNEVNDADIGPRRYRVDNLFRRLGQKDDPWADMAHHAADIGTLETALRAWERD